MPMVLVVVVVSRRVRRVRLRNGSSCCGCCGRLTVLPCDAWGSGCSVKPVHPNASKGSSRHTPASHDSHPPSPSPLPPCILLHAHSTPTLVDLCTRVPSHYRPETTRAENKTYQATSTDRPVDVMEGVLGFVFCLLWFITAWFVFTYGCVSFY